MNSSQRYRAAWEPEPGIRNYLRLFAFVQFQGNRTLLKLRRKEQGIVYRMASLIDEIIQIPVARINRLEWKFSWKRAALLPSQKRIACCASFNHGFWRTRTKRKIAFLSCLFNTVVLHRSRTAFDVVISLGRRWWVFRCSTPPHGIRRRLGLASYRPLGLMSRTVPCSSSNLRNPWLNTAISAEEAPWAQFLRQFVGSVWSHIWCCFNTCSCFLVAQYWKAKLKSNTFFQIFYTVTRSSKLPPRLHLSVIAVKRRCAKVFVHKTCT